MVGRATCGRGAVLAIFAALALPAGAAGEELVPPDNSAVDQYTETYPTARGDRETRGAAAKRTPAQVLGPRKARRLERRGPAGEAAAALAAATTTPPVAAAARPGSAEAGGPPRTQGAGEAKNEPPAASSGLGEVLGQAIGLSGDGRGALLLAALLAAAVWALAYRRRSRRSGAGP